ncbi:hypothetical protein [Cupriavidus basilensis]|uniref:hypothetical protein n=1 Tax=Cupriavidus basilensis TaxID=68895 RepID=UPI0020A6B5DA|nr:hypothetical protein [Cupriavidus basilensis]MCP3024562.1 hypothetical protein [Cupriavidus basilensis]
MNRKKTWCAAALAAMPLRTGVCAGAGTEAAHRDRLVASLQAARVACWPFGGAIGLRDDDCKVARIHVVRNWRYLGSAPDLARARSLRRVAPAIDTEAYRVLCKSISWVTTT